MELIMFGGKTIYKPKKYYSLHRATSRCSLTRTNRPDLQIIRITNYFSSAYYY